MKCIIPGSNVKVLARAIHALAKIGDEIYVSPQERSLSFRATSRHNVAYCDFTFTDNFFSYYNYGNLTEEDALKCKIPMRAAMAVFKTPVTLDKLIETCHIRLEPDAIKLMMILKYKNSVVKRFFLPIIDCEGLEVHFNKDNRSNKITVQPALLTGALSNFQQNLHEITLDVTADTILMRNYVNDTCNTSNVTRTQLALAVGEFHTYKITKNACITFCLKELRAMLVFAEVVGNSLNIVFENAGTPVVFVLKNAAFEGNLVLVTLNPDCDYSYDISLRGKRKTPARRTTPKTKKTTAKLKTGQRSIKTVEAVNSILASVHNRNGSRLKNNSQLEQQSDIESLDEPQLISAIRSTSISSEGTTEGRLSKFPSPKSPRVDLIEETPSSCGTSDRKIPSIFINSLKRPKRAELVEVTLDDNNDSVPESPPPPAKRAKRIFKKCFHSTFDPRMLPGHDVLLAEDSDEEQPVITKRNTH